MEIQDKKYLELLEYIRHELTPSEEKDVESWINLNDTNRKIYKDILRKNYYLRWSLKSKQINSEYEWNKLSSSLNKNKRIKFYYVAASIVLLLSFSLYLATSIEKTNIKVVVSQIIKPGVKSAELILSNGEKVAITNKTTLLKENNGQLINIDSLNGITYKDGVSHNSKLLYNTIRTQRGNEYNLQLSDGTRIWLNSDSELKYPTIFDGDVRKVYLLKGNAYFKVAKNKAKAFIVKMQNQQIKVYGTQFCVDAYNKNNITTVLVEGSIGLSTNTVNEVRLKPGELGKVNMESGDVEVKKVDLRPYIAWQEGSFVFRNQRLEDIMMQLERWYNVTVFYQNSATKDYHFTGDMKRYETINQILDFISLAANVKFEVKNNTVIVKNK